MMSIVFLCLSSLCWPVCGEVILRLGFVCDICFQDHVRYACLMSVVLLSYVGS